MSQKLILENCQLNYQIDGTEGDWVTLVNGHTRSHKDFKIFSRKIVAAGYRVLTLDNRGSGETVTSSPFTFEDMANDIKSLWKHLHIEHSHLLGISMGGWICQLLAADSNCAINSLVLVSTSSRVPSSLESRPSWGSTKESIRERLTPYFSRQFTERNTILIDAMAKQILQNNLHGDFDKMADAQKNAIKSLSLDGISALVKPATLIIHGSEDRIIDISEAHLLGQKISHSTIDVFDGKGHLLLAESATDLFERSIGFFKSHTPSV